MEPVIPEGWEQDSHTLYLHSSGVRIERRVYRSKEGWVLVPVDLDRAVVEFPPNSDGLGLAFAAFARGAPGSVATTSTREARDAARRDENHESASDDEEKEKEEEDDD